MLTGAAKINDFRSKLAFRSRFARSGAHFYAQARWFRTLCTGAVVLQNCAKPSRLSAKIASLQNRRKPMVLGPDSLARNRRYVSLSAPPAAEGQKRLIEPFSGGASPVPSRAPPGPLPDGSRTPPGRLSGASRAPPGHRLRTQTPAICPNSSS